MKRENTLLPTSEWIAKDWVVSLRETALILFQAMRAIRIVVVRRFGNEREELTVDTLFRRISLKYKYIIGFELSKL